MNSKSLISCTVIALILASIFSPAVSASIVYGPVKFNRTDGGPALAQDNFSLSRTDGNFSLFIKNGDGVENLTSSALIRLNGETVVRTNEFNQNVFLISKNISVAPTNGLEVEMRSIPGSYIRLWVEDESPVINILSPWDDAVPNGTIIVSGNVTDLNITNLNLDHNGNISTVPVVKEKLTSGSEILKDRVTFDIKKMTAADAAGKSTAGYLGNLKGAYTESLAKSDIVGNTVIDLKHINKGGVDYAALEGGVLKIVEAKARQSLTLANLKKNYIIVDKNGVIKGFNADYVIKDVGENYFKDASLTKQFILYLNGPNSQAIKNSLNLPASLPYKFTSKMPETKGQEFAGTVEIVVMAVNK